MEARCTVAGCNRSARRRSALLCERHYYRLRRTGTTADPVFAHKHQRADGYIEIKAPAHPLAMASGNVLEHRKVFFDAHGGGPFRCHVCGEPTAWHEMHVDHLNDQVDDNRLENLAPAHPTCNQWRGRPKMVRRNKAAGVMITHDGRTLCLSDWARKVGITEASLRWRLENGWPLERALTAARGKTGPKRSVSS